MLNSIIQNYIEVGSVAYSNGQDSVADSMFKAAIATANDSAGAQLRVALTFCQVAWAHAEQRRYRGAESCLRNALAIYKIVCGDQHPNVAKTLDALGYLSELQGKPARALQYYRRAEKATPVSFSQDPRRVLRLKKIAWLNLRLGRREAAIEAYNSAMQVKTDQRCAESQRSARCEKTVSQESARL